ncbi:MAG TPA: response regulator [Bacteroidota bacterium]|nr:response regulator [Bacteroidota bacterium]
MLLVEDEPIIALDRERRLRSCGYGVITAHSGESAVRIALKEPSIDVILMDVDLGRGMDGTQAAREILVRRPLPVVFLTSLTEDETRSRGAEIQGARWVGKNADDAALVNSLNAALMHRSPRP